MYSWMDDGRGAVSARPGSLLRGHHHLVRMIAAGALGLTALLGAGVSGVEAQQSAPRPPEVVRPTGPGWVGINVRVTETSEAPADVRVTDVWPDSPAEKAGLRAGDRILRVNGVDISPVQFKSLAQRLAPGDPMALTVDRSGTRVDLTVIAEPRPRRVAVAPARLQAELDSVRGRLSRILSDERLEVLDSAGGPARGLLRAPSIVVETMDGDSIHTRVILADSAGSAWGFRTRADGAMPPRDAITLRAEGLARVGPGSGTDSGSDEVVVRPLAPFLVGQNRVAGAEFRPMNPGLASFFGTDRGLLVTGVTEDTPAAEAGLTPGDVIVAANGEPVSTVLELRRRLERVRDGGPRSLTVIRRGETLELVVD